MKEIWSPVIVVEKSIDRNFNGTFTIENRYDFLNLNTCKFVWKQVKFPAQSDAKGMNKIIKQGEVKGSDMAAKSSGKLNLNTKIDPQADALFLTAIDYRGEEIWRWSFALPKENEVLKVAGNVPTSTKTDSVLVVSAGNNSYAFSNKNGELNVS